MTEEDRIQKSIVEYVRAVLPDAICFAVPNGGARSKATGAVLKATGVLAGVSDLCILPSLPIPLALFAEIKTPSGRVSPEQRAFGMNVQAKGHCFAVWRSIEDARSTFKALNIVTRESVP